jgi:hypothetical protein
VTPRRRRWLIGAAIAILLVAIAINAAARIPFSSEALRTRVVETLADRLDAEVELATLTLSVLPTVHAEGTGLVIRHHGRTDVPPLITAASFVVNTSLMDLWRRRVGHVKLDGLEIQIPPDDDPDHANSPEGEGRTVGITGEHYAQGRQVVVEEVVADAATLVIIPRNREKQHRTWVMHKLRVRNVSVNTKMPFETTLTNAVPPGEIVTDGSFGPWHRDDPGHTPIDGRFTFARADLSVFKGIKGTLSSTGTYEGRLETITARGEADVPDFTVEIGGHPVPLHTTYHAIIDGTNGDTRLERVDATFLDTSITASGGVYDVKRAGTGAPGADVPPTGREVTLAVVMEKGRLEDVMRLAVSADTPPMTGALTLQTTFIIPPGDVDIVDKLRLEGRFSIEGGRFTDAGVQTKINDMSRRASGDLAESKTQPAAPRVASDFEGRFALRDAVLRLPSLVFDIPGAAVKLNGQYALRPETIAFSGNLYMDAKVSQMVTGWKSMLLKVADPLFRRDGQTVVPIKISGTRKAPAFGMDVRRVFRRGD